MKDPFFWNHLKAISMEVHKHPPIAIRKGLNLINLRIFSREGTDLSSESSFMNRNIYWYKNVFCLTKGKSFRMTDEYKK